MKNALVVLCVISALLPCLQGAITCAHCGIGVKDCTTTCSGEACIAIKEVSTLEPNVDGTYKGCVALSQCKPLSITLSTSSKRHIQSTTACCENNSCNDNLTLSELPTSDTENGVTCPVCEKQNEAQCKTSGYIACTGLEEKCITLVGTSLDNADHNVSLKGCASRNACNMLQYDLMAYNGSVYNLTMNATCSDRGTPSALSSPAAVFLPAMVGYLLVSVLP